VSFVKYLPGLCVFRALSHFPQYIFILTSEMVTAHFSIGQWATLGGTIGNVLSCGAR
jgi:hypothetical protein